MPSADDLFALRPDLEPAQWARIRARWAARGWIVGHGTAAEWGAGKAGSRLLIATALAALLERDPAGIGTARDERGRPYPVDAATGAALPADVNLSHTEDLLVLGVARRGRIGVDVERADRDIATRRSMLARVCHPVEHAAVEGLPHAARTDAIARIWVCKEAVAKADGRGLALDLAALRADVPPAGYRVTTARLDGYWLAAAVREET